MAENVGNVTPIAERGELVPTKRIVQPADLTAWRRKDFSGFTPEDLSSTLTRVERGDTESWADLCSFVLRRDAVVRSAVETRRLAVAGAEFSIVPGRHEPGEEKAAEEAAEFVRRSLEYSDRLERVFGDLLHAEPVGWSVLEHDWQRFKGAWHSINPRAVAQRDTAFDDDWVVKVRTYTDGIRPKWTRLDNENPHRFIVHLPGGVGETPNLSGDMMAIIWQWLFKRWLELYRQEALERSAGPRYLGTLAPNAAATAREALFDALEAFTTSHVGVIEDGTTISTLESARSPGSDWSDAIAKLDEQIIVGILGSSLNVMVGDTGGNRALGESQVATTILPRLNADAKRLATTIERDWFEPLLKFNAHVFNGVAPPTPRLEFTLGAEEETQVLVGNVQMAVSGGVMKKDELRKIAGLDPLGPENGGDEFVDPFVDQMGSAPMSRSTEDGQADPLDLRRPLRRRRRWNFSRNPEQLRLPLTSTTSPTSSRFQTQIEGALASLSDDPES